MSFHLFIGHLYFFRELLISLNVGFFAQVLIGLSFFLVLSCKISPLTYLKSSLLRCKLYIIKCILLSVWFSEFWQIVYTYVTATTAKTEKISITWKNHLVTLCSLSPPPSHTPDNHSYDYCPCNFVCSKMLHEWGHMVWSFLCLASFT